MIVLAIGAAADDDAIFDIATRPFYDNVFFAQSYELLSRIGQDMRTLYCVTGVSTPIPPEVGMLFNLEIYVYKIIM